MSWCRGAFGAPLGACGASLGGDWFCKLALGVGLGPAPFPPCPLKSNHPFLACAPPALPRTAVPVPGSPSTALNNSPPGAVTCAPLPELGAPGHPPWGKGGGTGCSVPQFPHLVAGELGGIRWQSKTLVGVRDLEDRGGIGDPGVLRPWCFGVLGTQCFGMLPLGCCIPYNLGCSPQDAPYPDIWDARS